MKIRLIIIGTLWDIALRIEMVASKIQNTALGWCKALEAEYARLEDE